MHWPPCARSFPNSVKVFDIDFAHDSGLAVSPQRFLGPQEQVAAHLAPHALMPWCFARLRQTSGRIAATTDPVAFDPVESRLCSFGRRLLQVAAKALLHHE